MSDMVGDSCNRLCRHPPRSGAVRLPDGNLRNNTDVHRHAYELGEGSGTAFLHDPGTMLRDLLRSVVTSAAKSGESD